MAQTYESIATTTLGSAASTITFSSIPSTYTDLRLVISAIGTSGIAIRVHLNTTSLTGLYSYTSLVGDGTNATSGKNTNRDYLEVATSVLSTTIPHFYLLDLFNYAGNTYKTILSSASEDENGTGYTRQQVSLWRDTSTISSIIVTTSTSTFATGTTATLYGIKRV